MSDNRIRALEGLRAIAVLLVILYHAELGVPGGYIGVDVFFVISGFLITSILVTERRTTGRTSVRAFYGRRARRLIPASGLVTLSTLVAGWFVLDPIARRELSTDSLWASLFAANIRLARTGAEYLTTVDIPSALQHYWSLAVEEQFYFLWPLILVAAWRVMRGNKHAVTIVVSVIVVASFAACVRLTPTNPVWAYFAPWTRAWEMAAGGLLAVATTSSRRRALSWFDANALGITGIVVIVGCAFLYDDSTTFPGWASLGPVIGTIAVIAQITAHTSVNSVLGMRGMTWIGERSYSLYLWHWPLLTLASVRFDGLSAQHRAVALVATVVLAALTFSLVENPVRHSPLLVRHAHLSLAVGATITLVVAGAAFAASSDESRSQTGYIAATSTSTSVLTTTPSVNIDSLIRTEESRLADINATAVRMRLVPDNLQPTPGQAANSDVAGADIGCLAGFRDLESPTCTIGDTSSTTRVVLFGDSHAAHWLPALRIAAMENKWHIVVLTKRACPSTGETVPRTPTTAYPECDTWRENSVKRIERERPSLVVMSNWRYKKSAPSYDAALDPVVARITGAGVAVMILADTPTMGFGVPQCVADHPRDVDRCSVAASSTLNGARRTTEQTVLAARGGIWVDTTPWICDMESGQCPAVIGNVLVYRDRDHMTETMSGTLSTVLGLHVRRAVDR